MLYRIRETGAILTQGQVRGLYPNTSFPAVWDISVCEFIGVDPILTTPKPEAGVLEEVIPDGVELDSNNNWVEKWLVKPLFSEYTDSEGNTHTKEEQEAAYLAKRNETQWNIIREQRNIKLQSSDWTQVNDAPVNSALWATYRQELRDITKQADPFNIVWPVEPGKEDLNGLSS